MRASEQIIITSLLGNAGIPSWAAPGSLFGLDFANNRYWPQPLASQTTFSRASVGEADNISGAWSQFLSGVARITNKGLRYEPGRTNSIRNDSMVGAVAGAPGTLPTNWSTAFGNGLTPSISLATINGISTITFSLVGTATLTTNLNVAFEGTQQVAAILGQAWSLSQSMAATVNSGTTPTFQIDIAERNSSGGAVTDNMLTVVPTASLQRFSTTATLSGAATAFAFPRLFIGIVSGQAYNFSVTIGWPQLEFGASATSPVITSGAAVARLADVLSLIRTDIGRIVFTFSDGTTQTVSGITKGSPYTVPTTLNEQVIARMDGYAS